MYINGSMIVDGTVYADKLATGYLDINSEAEVDNGSNGLLAKIADTGNSQSLDGGLEVGIYCNNSAWAGYFINGHTKPTMVLVNAGTSCNGANRSPILNGGKTAIIGSSIPAYTLQIFNDGDIETEGSGSFESGVKAPGSYLGYQQDVYPDLGAFVASDASGNILSSRGISSIDHTGTGQYTVNLSKQHAQSGKLGIIITGATAYPMYYQNVTADSFDVVCISGGTYYDKPFTAVVLGELV